MRLPRHVPLVVAADGAGARREGPVLGRSSPARPPRPPSARTSRSGAGRSSAPPPSTPSCRRWAWSTTTSRAASGAAPEPSAETRHNRPMAELSAGPPGRARRRGRGREPAHRGRHQRGPQPRRGPDRRLARARTPSSCPRRPSTWPPSSGWPPSTGSRSRPGAAAPGCPAPACPTRGGIVVSFEQMNRVLEIDTENHVAVVQPGVTLEQLNADLAPHGFFYPVSPGENSASLGRQRGHQRRRHAGREVRRHPPPRPRPGGRPARRRGHPHRREAGQDQLRLRPDPAPGRLRGDPGRGHRGHREAAAQAGPPQHPARPLRHPGRGGQRRAPHRGQRRRVR